MTDLIERALDGLFEGPCTLPVLVERIGRDVDAGKVLRALQAQCELRVVECGSNNGRLVWSLTESTEKRMARQKDAPAPASRAPAPAPAPPIAKKPTMARRVEEFLLGEQQPLSNTEIANALNINAGSCYTTLLELVKHGKAVAIGIGHGRKFANMEVGKAAAVELLCKPKPEAAHDPEQRAPAAAQKRPRAVVVRPYVPAQPKICAQRHGDDIWISEEYQDDKDGNQSQTIMVPIAHVAALIEALRQLQ